MVVGNVDNILIINIKDLKKTSLISKWGSNMYAYDIEMSKDDKWVYVRYYNLGFKIINISDLKNPIETNYV
jgi:hypothetical protein